MMRIIDCGEDLFEQLDRPLVGNRSGLSRDHPAEISTRNILQHDTSGIAAGNEIVDTNDIGMIELRLNEGFAFQPVAEMLDLARAKIFSANRFDDHFASQSRVTSEIQLAHS